MKAGRNDPCPCGSGKKYKKCCLDKPAAADIKPEELPVYKTLMSDTGGSKSVVVARERPDGNIQFISVLVDEWKMGLKNCFGSRNISKKRFHREAIENMNAEFIDVGLDECKWTIKQGIRIAEAVGARIPREFYQLKDIVGSLDDIHITGSLYKCYLCRKGELSDREVGLIKEITYQDMARGVCGTPDETCMVFVCDDCKNKPHTELKDDRVDETDETDETDEEYDDWEDTKTRENYPDEVKKSLREMSLKEYDEILKSAGWDTWGPVACMDCDREENISIRCFAVKCDLEPKTLKEEKMLSSAVKEFSKIPGLGEDSIGGTFLGDYFIIEICTCGKCGSHNIFSDF